MYSLMDAHPLTVVLVVAAVMVTPFYAMCTYAFSGAALRTGALVGSAFLVWGSIMTYVCLADVTRGIGPLGQLVVPACWTTPTLVLLLRPGWFLSRPLSQHWLIGLQLWRAIGGVFLIEMERGNLPGVFAYPAALGDLMVAIIAAAVLAIYWRRPAVPTPAVLAVAGLGIADFLSAFFFGFTSSKGPLQIFFPDVANSALLFPTGLIPLFLVPYAIFFHALSLLSLRRSRGEDQNFV